MYRFSKSYPAHNMELICIYYFGEEKWRAMVDEQFPDTAAEADFVEFMDKFYKEAMENLGERVIEDKEIITVLNDGETFEMFAEVERERVISYVKGILNRNTMSVNDFIKDLEETGFDKYIGMFTEDGNNRRTYLFIFNKNHDDIYYTMGIDALKPSGFAAATGLCLLGEYVGRASV